MSNEEETLEVSPKELEFCFSQAARFGAFIHFLNSNRSECKKIFERHFGDDFNPDKIFQIDDDNKKLAILELVHMFHKSGTPGNAVLMQLSELYQNEGVWDNVENFSALCHMAKKRFSKQ